MSKDAFKKIVKNIRKQTEPIIATALINGATRVSNEMNDVVSDGNQSPRILLRKIAITLRSGVIATGQEMITSGVESIKKNRA
ncbi:hypothetical protein [Metabacillus arenae]|uniref:Uncharacterized protein n=1 Tax=Metabacillus arenae TaxID=2771434 RepID=A0A926NE49_9BACI|nr:hypothetical protein [Metabacillus arenae]MBD1379824.1 hypothetical protein [Metabacillus arenae]